VRAAFGAAIGRAQPCLRYSSSRSFRQRGRWQRRRAPIHLQLQVHCCARAFHRPAELCHRSTMVIVVKDVDTSRCRTLSGHRRLVQAHRSNAPYLADPRPRPVFVSTVPLAATGQPGSFCLRGTPLKAGAILPPPSVELTRSRPGLTRSAGEISAGLSGKSRAVDLSDNVPKGDSPAASPAPRRRLRRQLQERSRARRPGHEGAGACV